MRELTAMYAKKKNDSVSSTKARSSRSLMDRTWMLYEENIYIIEKNNLKNI